MNRLPATSRMRQICEVLQRIGPTPLCVLVRETGMPYDTLKKYLKRLKDRQAIRAEKVGPTATYAVYDDWRQVLDKPEPDKAQAPDPVNADRGRLTRHLHRAWPQPSFQQGA